MMQDTYFIPIRVCPNFCGEQIILKNFKQLKNNKYYIIIKKS